MNKRQLITLFGVFLALTGFLTFNSFSLQNNLDSRLSSEFRASVTLLFPITGGEATSTAVVSGSGEQSTSIATTEPPQPPAATDTLAPSNTNPSVPATATVSPAAPNTATNEPGNTNTPSASITTTPSSAGPETSVSVTVTPSTSLTATIAPTTTLTLTTTQTGTNTSTATATETGDITWSVEVQVPVSKPRVDQMGGAAAVKSEMEGQIGSHLSDNKVKSEVKVDNATAGNTNFKVSLAGGNGLSQFRKAIYSDLRRQVNLLGGSINLDISGDVVNGKELPILLESNPSTGYIWKVIGDDNNLLDITNQNDFSQKVNGIGAPGVQTIRLNGKGNGSTTIHLYYGRPWEGNPGANRHVTVNAGSKMPQTLDLSAPDNSSPISNFVSSGLATNPQLSSSPSVGLPTTFDWNSQGKVTSVRNQSSCGACWAFATVGVMEAAIKIAGGGDVDLSEQYLINCNNSGYDCTYGGWWAHDYHINRYVSPQTSAGAVLESALPYTAANGTCTQPYVHPYKLTSWYTIAGDSTVASVDQIKNAIYNYGPVASAICVGTAFDNYTSGVFSTDETSSCSGVGNVNHAIILTGWDDGTGTWILRNSWGPYWGESGYMHIKWGTSRVGYSANYVVYTPASTATPGGPTSTPTTVPTATPTTTPLTNDDFNNAMPVSLTSNAWSATQNVSNATSAADDPNFSCTNTAGYKSVWFKYVAPTTGLLTVDTIGSSYDTVLGIWQGTRGSLTSVACNDDGGGNYTSKVSSINVTQNQIYYIEVAGYYTFTSGSLMINLTHVPTITLTPSNTPSPTNTPQPVGPGTYDDRDSHLVYNGGWVNLPNPSMLNGTYNLSTVIGSTASLTFTGTSVKLIYYTNYDLGVASVFIDGTQAGTINQYSSTIKYQQQWSSPTLSNGTHTVTLQYASGSYINLDAITVISPPTSTPTYTATTVPTSTQTPTATLIPTSTPTTNLTQTSTPSPTNTPQPVGAGTYDDRDSHLVYSGGWVNLPNSSMLNGTYNLSTVIGSTASLTFTGTSVKLIYYTNYDLGVASVFIDGTQAGTINQYSSTIKYQQQWGSPTLSNGTHTVTLQYASGSYINLDAITVISPPTSTPTYTATTVPTSTQTPTATLIPTSTPTTNLTQTSTPRAVGAGTYDDRDSHLVYSGGWVNLPNSSMLNGTYNLSTVIGSTASLTFTGTSVKLIYYTNYDLGVASVFIDGTQAGTINQYSSTIKYQQQWGSPTLSNGTHTVTLQYASGSYINLDAITVISPPTSTPTYTATTVPTSTQTPTATLIPTSTPTTNLTQTSTPRAVGAGTYDDRDSHLVYSGGWVNLPNSSMLNGHLQSVHCYWIHRQPDIYRYECQVDLLYQLRPGRRLCFN